MSAQLHAGVPLADGSPARKLLEDLSRSYTMMLVADSKGRIHWMSDGWTEACGGVVPDFTNRDLRDAIPKMPRPEQSFRILTALREHGFLLHARVDGWTEADPGGEPLDLSILPLSCSTGGGVQVVLARAAKPGLDRSESRLLDDMPDATLVSDPSGFIAYASPAVEALLDLAPDALRGAAVATLAADGTGLGQLLQALEASDPSHFELAVRTGRSEPQALAVSVAPRLQGGAILTLRPSAETSAELIRRNDELEHCVNTLAHDLRSPLVALLGFSRLLRQDYGERLDDTGSHFIDRIEQAGRTMEALIHDLLELSRIGQPGEHPAMVDPRAVLLQLAAEMKPRLDTGGIELVLPKDPPLVYSDRTRLYQVFSNLIGNAIEHMGECDERRIEVEVRQDAGFHRIIVSDRGRGIDPQDHDRIFDAFQSLGARREGRKGTGMGLAIVRKIADSRGGRAWVESAPGAGATFHVTLPVH